MPYNSSMMVSQLCGMLKWASGVAMVNALADAFKETSRHSEDARDEEYLLKVSARLNALTQDMRRNFE